MTASTFPVSDRKGRALVFGSLNLDYVIRVARVPAAGETFDASALRLLPRGKGGNQAVALARMGVATSMIGCVGTDPAGQTLSAALAVNGVDVTLVRKVAGVPSGSAFVIVDQAGENRIIIVAGCNGEVGPPELAALEASLRGARVLLLQFEIPLEIVTKAARAARKANVNVILDPAPGQAFPGKLRGLVNILTPNETEAAILTGRSLDDDPSAMECALSLREQSRAQAVIVKRGGKGIVVASGGTPRIVRAPAVEVADTTAAGDVFNGSLGAAICNGASLDDAITVAIAAGALSVTKTGSQSSIPTLSDVQQFMARS